MSIIADMIRKTRDGAGLTRAEAAELLGVDWRRIWEWEEGRRVPRNLDEIIRTLNGPKKRKPRRRAE